MMKTYAQFDDDMIELPQTIILDMINIIADVYENISVTILTNKIVNFVILVPRNEDYFLIIVVL